jgi:HSP20 family molecular chaperone IbpA
MKRKEVSFGLNLGDLLRGLGGILDTAQNVDGKGRSTVHKIGRFGSNNPSKIKLECNFNMKMGDLQAGASKFENNRTMEPIVNVFEEEDYILVISELTGIEENQIQIRIIDSCLEIYAFGVQNYQATIPLPCSIDEKTIIYQYKKDTLEITIRKKRKLKEGQ